jgi:hypothetical protein
VQIKPVIIITAIAPNNESIQLDMFAPVVDDFTKPAQIKPATIVMATAIDNESFHLDMFVPVIYNYLGYYSYN